MKIAYNNCYGGFGLSLKAVEWMAERGHAGATEALKDVPNYGGVYFHPERDDALLIECIETLGSKDVSDTYARLAIAEIPDGAEWEIDEYDGSESIVPPRQSW